MYQPGQLLWRKAKVSGGNNSNFQPGQLLWRKAKVSGGNNSNGCVEVADLEDGGKAVRDSKNPTGPILVFTAHEWLCFLDGVGKGEFNTRS